MTDPVNHPPHYKANGLEVIDVIEAFGLDQSFCLGNVVKYVLRHARKASPLEDLRKAAWYLAHEIERLAGAVPAQHDRPLESFRLCYLATPYSKFPDGLPRANAEASKIAAQLMKRGVKVYSPIAHCHALAVHGEINPLDHEIWLPFDEAMMEAADALVVAQMTGWDSSFGIAHEQDFFRNAGKPILYLHPDTLAVSRVPHGKTRSEHGGGSA